MTTAFREAPAAIERATLEELQALDELTWGPQPDAVQAACLEADPELFFAEAPADLERAKLVCQPCPLREQCLAGALERREPHGVWGGEIFAEGRVIERKRPRGRPRKNPLPAQELAA